MKILLSILLFLVSFVSFSQTVPQRNNVPWYEYTRKLSVGQRFAPPTDTLSYPPGAINRDTTGLLAFASNGNLYKLWNGVWALVGGAGSDVQILGDSAIVVDDDTLIIRPIQFETDLAPEYAFQDGDTIRLYPRQYIQDSVLITKSGDTLFFPNGDTLIVQSSQFPVQRVGEGQAIGYVQNDTLKLKKISGTGGLVATTLSDSTLQLHSLRFGIDDTLATGPRSFNMNNQPFTFTNGSFSFKDSVHLGAAFSAPGIARTFAVNGESYFNGNVYKGTGTTYWGTSTSSAFMKTTGDDIVNTNTNNGIYFQGRVSGSAPAGTFQFLTNYNNTASQQGRHLAIYGTFNPSSGASPWTSGISGLMTYNQTGTASGAVTFIEYAPTITSLLGAHNFITATTGNTLLATTSGGLGVGVSSIAASAKVEIASTTQGFLPPRMTATQASAISSPAEGLLVYVTDTNGTFTTKGWWGYNGAAWEKLNN